MYMYISFQQIWVSGSVKTVLTNIFATTNSNFEKNRLIQICVIVKRKCISIFSKLGSVDQSKPCTLIYLQKIASCINLQLPIVILKKSILLNMHHLETYMYINFQQNQVSRSDIIVHTNVFAKKIANCINLQLPTVIF